MPTITVTEQQRTAWEDGKSITREIPTTDYQVFYRGTPGQPGLSWGSGHMATVPAKSHREALLTVAPRSEYGDGNEIIVTGRDDRRATILGDPRPSAIIFQIRRTSGTGHFVASPRGGRYVVAQV